MKKLLPLLFACCSFCASAQKKSSFTHTPAKATQKKNITVSLDEAFEGCWATRNPAFYLHLEKGKKFESNDFNPQTHKVEHLTGTWLIAENALMLNFNEIATQRLHFMLNKKSWNIRRNDGSVWIKADAAKCQ